MYYVETLTRVCKPFTHVQTQCKMVHGLIRGSIVNTQDNCFYHIARNKRTQAYISVYYFRLCHHRSQWQTLGAWYKASELELHVRRVSPPIILKLPHINDESDRLALKALSLVLDWTKLT